MERHLKIDKRDELIICYILTEAKRKPKLFDGEYLADETTRRDKST